MSGDEKIVRDAWEEVREGRMPQGSVLAGDCWVCIGKYPQSTFFYGRTPEDARSLAARYTEEIKRKIAEIEEEISTTRQWRGILRDDSNQAIAHDRILTRLQAIHADLKRGMRL